MHECDIAESVQKTALCVVRDVWPEHWPAVGKDLLQVLLSKALIVIPSCLLCILVLGLCGVLHERCFWKGGMLLTCFITGIPDTALS